MFLLNAVVVRTENTTRKLRNSSSGFGIPKTLTYCVRSGYRMNSPGFDTVYRRPGHFCYHYEKLMHWPVHRPNCHVLYQISRTRKIVPSGRRIQICFHLCWMQRMLSYRPVNLTFWREPYLRLYSIYRDRDSLLCRKLSDVWSRGSMQQTIFHKRDLPMPDVTWALISADQRRIYVQLCLLSL